MRLKKITKIKMATVQTHILQKTLVWCNVTILKRNSLNLWWLKRKLWEIGRKDFWNNLGMETLIDKMTGQSFMNSIL